MMPPGAIISVLVVYLLILLGLGYWGGRESGSVAGYYVARKRLPSWVIAFSSNATGESGWLLLGLTGMGYAVGFHALWIVLGEFLGVLLAWKYVARPFKEYTDRYDSITVPDYLESRFHDGGHVMRVISAVIILSMVTAYTAAQLTASGKAFGSLPGDQLCGRCLDRRRGHPLLHDGGWLQGGGLQRPSPGRVDARLPRGSTDRGDGRCRWLVRRSSRGCGPRIRTSWYSWEPVASVLRGSSA